MEQKQKILFKEYAIINKTKFMSEYGPAFFIKRKDKKEIEEKEQDMLFKLVTEISKKLKIKNDENGEIVSPKKYDYNYTEEDSVSFLMFSSVAWGACPEDLQQELSEHDEKKMLKIGKEIDKKIPNTYSYKCYYVEN